HWPGPPPAGRTGPTQSRPVPRQQLPDPVPMPVGQPPVTAVVPKRQLLVVDPQQVQDGRVQVVAVRRLRRPPRPLVALPECGPALDARPGQPGDRRAAVVVAAGRALPAPLPPALPT